MNKISIYTNMYMFKQHNIILLSTQSITNWRIKTHSLICFMYERAQEKKIKWKWIFRIIVNNSSITVQKERTYKWSRKKSVKVSLRTFPLLHILCWNAMDIRCENMRSGCFPLPSFLISFFYFILNQRNKLFSFAHHRWSHWDYGLCFWM